MAYTTGMSKEGKKLYNTHKGTEEEFKSLMTPEDFKIFIFVCLVVGLLARGAPRF